MTEPHIEQQIARVLDSELGEGPSNQGLAAQRARLVRWEQQRRSAKAGSRFSRRHVYRSLVLAGALAPLAVLLVWYGLGNPGRLVSFDGPVSSNASMADPAPSVAPRTAPPRTDESQPSRAVVAPADEVTGTLTATRDGRGLAADSWLNAEHEALKIQFSDDSRVTLMRGAQARMAQLDTRGVRWMLESGSLQAEVTPGSGYHWVFQAGPYRVQVLGTKLGITWQPLQEQLRVSVSRGRVRVSGGRVDGEGRTVAAGESLSIAPPGELASKRAHEQRARAPQPPQVPPRPDSSKPDEQSVKTGRAQPSVDWKVFAERGEFGRALQAAEARGFEALTQSVTASELLLLADSARLGGSVSKAKSALHALRQRYPSHPNALVAAFTLGRLAYEVEANYAEAVRWFRIYLRGAPSGALAEGARGRMLLALSRLGNRNAARRAANAYLEHHPDGPHAEAARSLLSNQ